MATTKLENLSLEQLNDTKQRIIKDQKNVFIVMITIFLLMVITAIWRIQQGTSFSDLVPFFVIVLCGMAAQRGSFQKKLNSIDKEIQKKLTP